LEYFGSISYSLYLWHWIIYSNNVIIYGDNLNFTEKFSILIVAILLSTISLKFIENPFRNKKNLNNKLFVLIAIFIALMSSNYFVYSDRLYYDDSGIPKLEDDGSCPSLLGIERPLISIAF
jgi:peptidoglycan/LPS O-acetylase OafA/YrhL